MMEKRTILSLFGILLVAALVSCETDSYDTGEGAYSQMTADFAELLSDGQKRGTSFVTDAGDSYQLQQALTASWITTADSTYRTTIYYKKVGEGVASTFAVGHILTLVPRKASSYKNPLQDPVGVESCWVSKNGKYLNLGLLLKNGRDSEGQEGAHGLGMMQDETRQNADGTSTVCYRLLHIQGDTPEYYTNRRYVSVLLPTQQRPDSVRLTIKTYDGDVVTTLEI